MTRSKPIRVYASGVHLAHNLGAKHYNYSILQVSFEDGFYSARLNEKFQIDVILPQAASRKIVDSIIYNELCVGIFSEQSKITLLQIIDKLVQSGAECILLSCTELGMLIKADDYSSPIFDTTVLHTELAASLMIPLSLGTISNGAGAED